MEKRVLSRKEREREFKKQEILDASIKIFAEKGFKSATLDEIAEKSEFGKGTIYNYFSSKEEIYKEIISSIIEDHKNAIMEIDETSKTLYEFQLETTKKHMTFCINNKDAFLLLISTKMNLERSTTSEIIEIMKESEKEMIVHLIKKMKQAIELKEIRNLDIEKMLRLIKSTSFAYIYDLLVSQKIKTENIDDEAKFITDIMFNGINYK